MTTVPSPAQRPRRRRAVRWALVGVAAVVVLMVAAFAWDALRLRDTAAQLERHADAAQDAVSTRDAAALSTAVGDLQAAADAFASHTSGVHWTVAGWIPWVGDQTRPLREAGDAVQAVADDALGPLTDLEDLSALEVPPVRDGRIDPYVLEPYRENLAQAASVLARERASLDQVDVDATVGMVREPFVALEANLASLGDLVQGAHVAAQLLPPMLGAEGERTYLVMVQNNAEPRTTGGIAGAVIELTATDGELEFARYVTGESMQDRTQAVTSLTDDELRVFGERMVWYPQDVNFTPEVPRSAQVLTAFWEREFGEAPDGVISTDPVGLGYMLAGMEPVDIDGITVSGDNLAQVMMRDVYYAYDEPAQTDEFFAVASRQLFGELLAGGGQFTSGLEKAASQQRLLLWSAHAPEQDLLETTGIAGDFLSRSNALGVFVNDGSGSKIGSYIEAELAVTDRLCSSDGTVGGHTVQYTLTHSYDGAVEDLPPYVGVGGGFVPNGEFHANVLVFPPEGLGVTHFTRDGETDLLNGEDLHGRGFSTARVTLVPGQTVVLTYELAARDRGIALDSVVSTPGPFAHDVTRSVDKDSADC